jgi:hypothetical protein
MCCMEVQLMINEIENNKSELYYLEMDGIHKSFQGVHAL